MGEMQSMRSCEDCMLGNYSAREVFGHRHKIPTCIGSA